MTRKWGRAYDAWYTALTLRQKLGGGDGLTCEKCGSHADKAGVTLLIVAHPKGYDPDREASLDELALWHQSCNIRADPPNQGPRDVPPKREREFGAPEPTLTQSLGSQSEKSGIMRARWLGWINDLKNGPFAQFEYLAVKSLTKWAPRACARKEIGEESLGVPQSYEDYVEMDSTDFGGPLHIFTPKEGSLKGILCVEYVRKETVEGRAQTIPTSVEAKA
jgi:hypothetical protein